MWEGPQCPDGRDAEVPPTFGSIRCISERNGRDAVYDAPPAGKFVGIWPFPSRQFERR